jgi:hypothetical protein
MKKFIVIGLLILLIINIFEIWISFLYGTSFNLTKLYMIALLVFMIVGVIEKMENK